VQQGSRASGYVPPHLRDNPQAAQRAAGKSACDAGTTGMFEMFLPG
jgi:hypothetical protein